MTLLRDVAGNTPLANQLILDLVNFRKGVTSPTDSTIGTSPVTPTLLFAATNELVSTFLVMPPTNWDRTVDCTLVLIWALSVAETNGDVLSVTLDYTVPLKNTTGSGPGKASTQVLGTTTVTTADGLAAEDVYTTNMVLPSADATNPFTSDDAQGFSLELHLTNTVGVGAAHLLGGCVAYEMTH